MNVKIRTGVTHEIQVHDVAELKVERGASILDLSNMLMENGVTQSDPILDFSIDVDHRGVECLYLLIGGDRG